MRPAGSLLQRLASWWRGGPEGPFQLTRYFTAASLVAFAVLALALYLLERSEQRFFAGAQREQGAFVALVQAQLLKDQKEVARASLIATHEAGHVTLTRVFANAVWQSHFAPLVQQAQGVPVERCRRPPGDASPPDAAAQQECVAELRRQVSALPGFAAIDAPVRALMRETTVFKIKVYDLRGLTVYSSELNQVGEDKSDNAGWKAAAAGRPASELVHRNRFSAFEGEVQDRDLIQSYIPAAARGGGIGGVFEIYSDVTPLLRQLEDASQHLVDATGRNQALVREASQRFQRGAERNSAHLLLVVAALLAVVYLALLALVRNGQRIIDTEARSRDQAALREQEWHRDKMATLAAMAANVSHEVGNPLAIISGLAQEIAHWRQAADFDPQMPNMIVEQTARIASLTRRISDFATGGGETPVALDINQLAKAVCEFLAFDRRFRGTPVELRLAEGLPACVGVPDHLTEVLMGMLLALEAACAAACGGGANRISVATAAEGAEVVLRIGGECPGKPQTCELPLGDTRLESARRRIEGMGGQLQLSGPGLVIRLPCAAK